MKLSEPQKRVLRTMLEFDCGIQIYEGVQFTNRARAWFDGEAARHPTKRFIYLGTVHALARRRLLTDIVLPWENRSGFRYFTLTPKGQELAKELLDAQGDGTSGQEES